MHWRSLQNQNDLWAMVLSTLHSSLGGDLIIKSAGLSSWLNMIRGIEHLKKKGFLFCRIYVLKRWGMEKVLGFGWIIGMC